MEQWRSLKQSGIPALLAVPALLWFALCFTTMQALCLVLVAFGMTKEYTEATRFLISVLHRPFLYLMQYSNSRIYDYSAKGDVKAEVLNTIGFDQSVILSNHRGDLDWLIGLMVEDNGGGLGCCKAIVKRELIFLPLFGFSWWAADFICINRNWQTDRRRLDAGFKRQHDYSRWAIPYTLTIFPEGTRLTEAKLVDSQEYCKSKGLPVLNHSLCPRAKGLWSAINSMRLDNVYDITVVEGADSKKANVLTLAQGTPAEFHVFIEKISPNDIPKNEEQFSAWLMERWQGKDERIARFQRDGQFIDAASFGGLQMRTDNIRCITVVDPEQPRFLSLLRDAWLLSPTCWDGLRHSPFGGAHWGCHPPGAFHSLRARQKDEIIQELHGRWLWIRQFSEWTSQ